ncbi:MAG TPA: hypothetical protein VFO16_23260 [Pseudonocardiaceae bacterium]|nr:hypothetical protein [Pseudonocardiaceae bacterium]
MTASGSRLVASTALAPGSQAAGKGTVSERQAGCGTVGPGDNRRSL